VKRLFLMAGIVVLPVLSGCSVFHKSPVPPSPSLTGIAAENAGLRDQVQRARHGGLPRFAPITHAEKAVNAARAQPQVEQFDSQSLAQAEQSLTQAQSDWQSFAKGDKPTNKQLAQVADEANRAQRLAEIAQYTAQREIGLSQLQNATGRTAQASPPQSHLTDAKLVGRKVVPDMLGPLEFEPGTARLTSTSHLVVARLAKLMQAHPKQGIAIFGFTDNTAPPAKRLKAFVSANPGLEKKAKTHAAQVAAYNQGLSSARARDVAQLLVQAGIDPHRIGARGFGSQHPIASNDTAAGRHKNERVEAVVVPLKQQDGG
jgi:outer membrane protein OmpA-like peptidoglycan-associated protein